MPQDEKQALKVKLLNARIIVFVRNARYAMNQCIYPYSVIGPSAYRKVIKLITGRMQSN